MSPADVAYADAVKIEGLETALDEWKARAEAAEAQCAALRQALEGTIDAGAALLVERDRLRETRDELLAVCEALVAGKQRDDVDDMAVGAIAKVKARAALGDG